MNEKDKLKKKAFWLRGVADGIRTSGNSKLSNELDEIANILVIAAANMCGQGYYDCPNGADCKSDHK